MSCDWTIKIDDAEEYVTLESLGLLLQSREAANLDQGGVTLLSEHTELTADPVLTTGQAVIIKNGGTVWFQGSVASPTYSAGADGVTWSYVVRDPWWALFSAPFFLQTGVDLYATLVPLKTSTAWNLLKAHVATYLSGYVQVADFAAIPDLYFTPYPLRNDCVGHNFLALLRLHIYSGLYVDHSTTPPTLRPNHAGENERSFAWGTEVVSAQLVNRDDLWPTAVAARVKLDLDPGWSDASPWMGALVPSAQYTSAPSPAGGFPDDPEDNLGAPGTLVLPISAYEDGATAVGAILDEEKMQAIVDYLYDALRQDLWVGGLVLEGVGHGVNPGDTVHITGGRAAWATANLLVQRVVENHLSKQTTLTVGLHSRFDLRSLYQFTLTWLRFSRQRGLFPPLPTEVISPTPPPPP